MTFVLTSWQIWAGLALLFIGIELLMPTHFFMALCGLAAGIIALFVWAVPAVTTGIQLTVYAVFLLAFLAVWNHYRQLGAAAPKPATLEERLSSLEQQVFPLSAAIRHGKGQIKALGSVWTVYGEDAQEGQLVRIVQVQGMTLRVEHHHVP